MKNVVLKDNKKEIKRKLFTKNREKSKINNNNLLDKDYNNFYEGEGLNMEKLKNIVIKKRIKGANLKEKIFIKLFPKLCIKLYRKGMLDCFNYYNKNGTF